MLVVDDQGVHDVSEHDADRVSVYVPENFDAQEILDVDPKRADAANWLIDRLYLFSHFGMREDQYGFTPLKVAYLRRVIPQTFERELRERLLAREIIECDHQYIKGKKSYGYRLKPKYRTRHKRIHVRHPIIRNNIQRVRKGELAKLSPVHVHLYNQFSRLSLDVAGIQVTDHRRQQWIQFNELAVEQLTNKQWTPVVCQYGRFHTPLTRLMAEYRSGLRLDEQNIINLDIANSQPLVLSLLFLKVLSKTVHSQAKQQEHEELQECLLSSERTTKHNTTHNPPTGTPYTVGEVINSNVVYDDVCHYVQMTEAGQLYEYLSQGSGISRREFKQNLFRDVFYGQNYIRSRLTDTFERVFPHVFDFIRRVKRGNYARLAWVMQREESKMMIDTVCGRMMNEYPNVPVLTIHDSIMTVPENEQIVKRIIMQEFNRVGLSPTVRTEWY